MQQQPNINAERILLVLHGSIGDVTRALPLAGLLRDGYPKAFIAWSVEPASAPLVEGNPAIDEVILFDRQHWWKRFAGFSAKSAGASSIWCWICNAT